MRVSVFARRLQQVGTALRGGGSLRPRVRRGHRGGRDGPQVGRAWGRARLGLCEVLKARRAGQPQVGGAVVRWRCASLGGAGRCRPRPHRAGRVFGWDSGRARLSSASKEFPCYVRTGHGVTQVGLFAAPEPPRKDSGCGCSVSQWKDCRRNREEAVFIVAVLNSAPMNFRLKFLKRMGTVIS